MYKAAQGQRLIELANAIATGDVQFDEALHFVDTLVKNQILIGELEPNLTGEDALRGLIKKLETLNDVNEFVAKLGAISDLLGGKSCEIQELVKISASVSSIVKGRL